MQINQLSSFKKFIIFLIITISDLEMAPNNLLYFCPWTILIQATKTALLFNEKYKRNSPK